jgi:hypothetical protein
MDKILASKVVSNIQKYIMEDKGCDQTRVFCDYFYNWPRNLPGGGRWERAVRRGCEDVVIRPGLTIRKFNSDVLAALEEENIDVESVRRLQDEARWSSCKKRELIKLTFPVYVYLLGMNRGYTEDNLTE